MVAITDLIVVGVVVVSVVLVFTVLSCFLIMELITFNSVARIKKKKKKNLVS